MLVFNLDQSVFIEIILSLLLGALVGIEREYHRDVEKRVNYLGVRTSMLLSLLGFVFGYLYTSTLNITVLLTSFIIITIISSLVYLAKVRIHNTAGATTYVAMFLVFTGGLLVGLGEAFLAAVIIILTTTLLAVKREFKEFVTVLNKTEILSAIKFGIISFIILPFLPNHAIDSWNIFNPFSFWLIVVVFSSINFFSFILSKIYNKGIVLSSLIGGFVSSTIVAYTLTRLFKKGSLSFSTALPGILLSDVGMIVSQVLVISLIVYPNLSAIKYSFLPAIIPAVFLVLYSFRFNKSNGKRINLKSPFSLKTALSFALIFFFVSLLSLVFKENLGARSLYFLSFVSSIANVGATVASMSLLASGKVITLQTFGFLSVISMVAGILSKLIWVAQSEDKNLFRTVVNYSILLSVLSLAIYFLQFVFIT